MDSIHSAEINLSDRSQSMAEPWSFIDFDKYLAVLRWRRCRAPR